MSSHYALRRSYRKRTATRFYVPGSSSVITGGGEYHLNELRNGFKFQLNFITTNLIHEQKPLPLDVDTPQTTTCAFQMELYFDGSGKYFKTETDDDTSKCLIQLIKRGADRLALDSQNEYYQYSKTKMDNVQLFVPSADNRQWQPKGAPIQLTEDRLYTKYQKVAYVAKGVGATALTAGMLMMGSAVSGAHQLFMGDEYLHKGDKSLFTKETRKTPRKETAVVQTDDGKQWQVEKRFVDVPFQMLIGKLVFPGVWSTPQSIFIEGLFKSVRVGGGEYDKAQVKEVHVTQVTLIPDEPGRKKQKSKCIDNNSCMYFKPKQ